MKNFNKTFISSTFWTERSGSIAALETLNQIEKNKTFKIIKQQGKKNKKNMERNFKKNKY